MKLSTDQVEVYASSHDNDSQSSDDESSDDNPSEQGSENGEEPNDVVSQEDANNSGAGRSTPNPRVSPQLWYGTTSNSELTLDGDGRQFTITGSNNTVTMSGSGATLLVSGSNNILRLTGRNTTLRLTGSGNTASLPESNHSVSVGGSNNVLTLLGNNNVLTMTGSVNSITLHGNGHALNSTGSGNSFRLTGMNSGVNISGSNNRVDSRRNGNNRIVMMGSNNMRTDFDVATPVEGEQGQRTQGQAAKRSHQDRTVAVVIPNVQPPPDCTAAAESSASPSSSSATVEQPTNEVGLFERIRNALTGNGGEPSAAPPTSQPSDVPPSAPPSTQQGNPTTAGNGTAPSRKRLTDQSASSVTKPKTVRVDTTQPRSRGEPSIQEGPPPEGQQQPSREDEVVRRMLIEQQDAAYKAALKADRDRLEKEQRELEEKRIAEEEKEAKKQLKLKIKEEARANLPPEPVPGGGDEGTFTIRFRLSDGTTFRRIFRTSDTLQVLIQVVLSRPETPYPFHILRRPNQVFPMSPRQTDQTLQELGFGVSEVLFVEDGEADDGQEITSEEEMVANKQE